MSTKRLLWIGSIVPENEYIRLCSLGYKNQQASRIAQLNIINGLEEHYGIRFDYVSGPALPGYPKFKELIVQDLQWKDDVTDSKGESVSYLNIEYINRIFKARALQKATERVTKEYSVDDDIVVFANSPHTPFMKAALEVKQKYSKVKLVLIIPDLPQFMESNTRSIKRTLKMIDIRIINSMLPQFDYYILYSAKMREYLGLASEKCLTMEGCATISNYIPDREPDASFTFLYSGKADFKYGIKLLVEAFQGIEGNDIKLIITGNGDASEYIREASTKDKRIIYYGFIDDYSKVQQMQINADVLLNMRLPSEEASNYCFPSKIFEYMKTGNPVISFKIGGIGEEYYDHLLLVEEETVECLRKTMCQAKSMTEAQRRLIGKNAREFIRKNKNYQIQTRRIYEFIEG